MTEFGPESALCKLRKKYVTKKTKEVCQLDSNPHIQALLSSLTVPTTVFGNIFRSNRHKPKGRRWSLKEKVLALSLLKRSLHPIHFFVHYFMYIPDDPHSPF